MLRPSSEIFDYEFSGVSVWLEPDETDAATMTNTMSHLAQACGGPSKGLYAFEPHCTMLYNIPSDKFVVDECNSGSGDDALTRAAQNLLEQCLQEYKTDIRQEDVLTLVPTNFNYFRYPPFRCIVMFLFLETTPALKSLHQILLRVFPSDERHDKGGSLMPHMSLVYAPESLNTFLSEEIIRIREESGPLLMKPMRAKYLSVWTTEGKTCDWERIARVELPR